MDRDVGKERLIGNWVNGVKMTSLCIQNADLLPVVAQHT